MSSAYLAAECLSEAGAYYGSDFPAAVHVGNASSPEACCRICQSTPDCSVWNWWGSLSVSRLCLPCEAYDSHRAASLPSVLMLETMFAASLRCMPQIAIACDEACFVSPNYTH